MSSMLMKAVLVVTIFVSLSLGFHQYSLYSYLGTRPKAVFLTSSVQLQQEKHKKGQGNDAFNPNTELSPTKFTAMASRTGTAAAVSLGGSDSPFKQPSSPQVLHSGRGTSPNWWDAHNESIQLSQSAAPSKEDANGKQRTRKYDANRMQSGSKYDAQGGQNPCRREAKRKREGSKAHAKGSSSSRRAANCILPCMGIFVE